MNSTNPHSRYRMHSAYCVKAFLRNGFRRLFYFPLFSHHSSSRSHGRFCGRFIGKNLHFFAKPGFTLVVTISLLVLLTMLVMGLLSLSTLTLRRASADAANAEAQSNARMAMMLALGELQKNLGRDQAISAPASLLDREPNTPELNDVQNPLLTGVWTSRRDALGSRPNYDRATSFRRWLASDSNSNAMARMDFAQSGSFTEPVTMVKAPTGVEASATGVARAGRVRTPRGAYAWWVGDENCKAYIGMRDDLNRNDTATVADRLASAATPGAHGIRALEGFEGFPSNTTTSDKLVTRAEMDLAQVGNNRPAAMFHDITPFSESVIADVSNGGLRQDLSLYLDRQDIDWLEEWGWAGGKSGIPTGPRGPNNDYALSNAQQYDVLSWKSLHHWYSMHRRQLSTSAGLPLTAMRNYVDYDPVSNAKWNSNVMRISPVMVRMQMIISYGVRQTAAATGTDGRVTYDLLMYSYPVLTLWNPYSVPLQVDQCSVFLHTLPLEQTVYHNGVKVNLTGGGTRNGNYNWGWPHGNMVMRFGEGTPAVSLAPGEAKILTYTTSQAGGFNAHDMVEEFRPWLPPGAANPRGQMGQERNLGTITGAPGDRISIETTGSSWHTSANSYSNFQTTFCYRTESKAVHRGHPVQFKQQMFTGQVAWRVESDAGNPIPDVISRTNFPSMTLGQLNNSGSPFLHLDVRLKTLDEVRLPNKTWLHNIPQHPYVSATSTQKHGSEVDAATLFFAHPYTLSFEQINGIEGVIQNRPFFGSSNRPGGRGTIIAQDIPLAPLTSLAQLQNLPQLPMEALNWSGYYFQNQAIGNSYASPGLPPQSIKERSFPFYLGEYFAWQGGDIAGNFYNDWTWFNNSDYEVASAPAAVIDRSYAANQLLFDSYFFSSLAGQQGDIFSRYGRQRQTRQVLQDFFDGTQSAPNAAYRRNLGPATPASVVTSLFSGRVTATAHQRVAANLMATGGFNVNSTSVAAWTAMLASSHLKRPVTLSNRGVLQTQAQARYVISRFSAPLGGTADSKPASENNRWLGYRELTEVEIRELAVAIVKQVKKRGPFRSLGEFVNRRLTTDRELALYGALQAALEDPAVSINSAYRGQTITKSDLSRKYVARYKFEEAALGSRFQGTPAYISQADILTPIAPILNARSDCFVIRGYGEARSADAQTVTARAWCEAVVQRVPEYVDALDAAHVAPAALRSALNRAFGRRFVIKSFRWLPRAEIEPVTATS